MVPRLRNKTPLIMLELLPVTPRFCGERREILGSGNPCSSFNPGTAQPCQVSLKAPSTVSPEAYPTWCGWQNISRSSTTLKYNPPLKVRVS